jgi:hypothetical protein
VDIEIAPNHITNQVSGSAITLEKVKVEITMPTVEGGRSTSGSVVYSSSAERVRLPRENADSVAYRDFGNNEN